MNVNPKIFRGSDIRGIAGVDLNPEIVNFIGKAYGTYLNENGIKDTIVGRDCRLSSEEYSQFFIDGLLSTGINVIDIGLTMIGTFYWSQYFLKTKGGAFITASHNPGEYNGFKLASDYSETLIFDGIQHLLKLVESEKFSVSSQKGSLIFRDINKEYYSDLLIKLPDHKPLTVVVDGSNTTAGKMAPELFRLAGYNVIEKNCNIDGSFPLGTADPTEYTVVKRLSDEVKETPGASVGFTFDADGDRIGVVDNQGNIIWNDTLLCLFAIDVLNQHPGSTIMYNSICSTIVKDTIIKNGGTPFMWRTGHSFLKKKNQEVKAAFIGELSGHFFFSKDFYNHDDGLYSSLRLLEFLSRIKGSLSEHISKLPQIISSPEIKLGCPDDKKINFINDISQKLIIDSPKSKIINDESVGDGVRLETNNSMFVIRYSHNGPYVTIKFEAKKQETYDQIKNYLLTTLKSFKDIDWSYGVNVDSLS